jgi:GNAT superfamily N-acetyltransferase
MITKRQATEADYEFVRSVHHAAYRDVVELQYGRWDEVEQDRLFDAQWVADAHEIVFSDSIECGYCRIEYMNDHILVRELVIDPRFQGRGIGTRIMLGVFDEAAAGGVPVRLQTQLVNRAANLYRRLGFRECDRTSTHILMEWRSV